MTAAVHTALVWVELGLAAVTFAVLLVITAPYGRHARRGFGPTIPARIGWVVMESPAVIAFAGIFFFAGADGSTASNRFALAPLVLLAMWQLHYVHRAFVFPFRLRGGARMPAVVAASGVAFNLLNACVNAGWIGHLGRYPDRWLGDPRFLAGAALFALGLGINAWADTVLLSLRRRAGGGYRVPRGGLYERVSCPNYLGEIVEWTGWAVATWSVAGLAFAVYTAANLVPRALAHHRWYQKTFPDYPSRRRALVPGVL